MVERDLSNIDAVLYDPKQTPEEIEKELQEEEEKSRHLTEWPKVGVTDYDYH